MKNKCIKIFMIFAILLFSVGLVNSSEVPIVLKVTGNIDLTEISDTYTVQAFVNNTSVSDIKYYATYDDLRLGLYNGFFTDAFNSSVSGVDESYSFVLKVSRNYFELGNDMSEIYYSDPISVPNPNFNSLNYKVDIVDESITTPKIKSNGVSGVDLLDSVIVPFHVAENTITSSKINNNSVKGSDFYPGAIISEKIIDNTIEKSKLKIVPAKNPPSYSAFLAKTEDGNFSWVSVVSDTYDFEVGQGLLKVDIPNGKYIGIGPELLVTGMFVDNSVNSYKIKDLAVINSKLSANSISNEKIRDDAVTTSKIKSEAVTNSKIDNKNITQDKLDKTQYYSLLKCGQTYYSVNGELYDLKFDSCNIDFSNSENKYSVKYKNIYINNNYYFSGDFSENNLELIKTYCNSRGGSLSSYTLKEGNYNTLLNLSDEGDLSIVSGTSKVENVVCEFYYIE